MSSPLKSLLNVATTSLLAVAPPPRMSNLLRKGRGSGRRLLSPRQDTAAAHHVVILGGGFGGLYTALRLHDLAKQESSNQEMLEITLVDRKDKFVFSPLLYELATNKAQSVEVSPFYSELLKGTSINFVQGSIQNINTQLNQVVVKQPSSTDGTECSEKVVDFNKLVVALGSECSNTRLVEGVDDYTLPFYTVDDALRLREHLNKLKSTKRARQVVVVGGGYIGVELACNVSEAMKDASTELSIVKLVVGPRGVLPNSKSTALQQKALLSLEKARVEICYQEVRSIQENTLTLETASGGEEEGALLENLCADLILWTAGSKPNALIMECFPASTNEDGRLKVENNLSVVLPGKELKLFALGDVSVCDDPLPASAQVVFQQSEYVAWNIWASITGQRLLNFKYTPLGEILALGKRDAVVMAPYATETGALPNELSGAFGSFLRRTTYALRMPTTEQRKRAFVGYFNSSLRNPV